jgi:hypothetical protein
LREPRTVLLCGLGAATVPATHSGCWLGASLSPRDELHFRVEQDAACARSTKHLGIRRSALAPGRMSLGGYLKMFWEREPDIARIILTPNGMA